MKIARFVLFALLMPSASLTAQALDRVQVARAIDSLVNEPIDAGQIAGASVAVVQGADTILMKAYGYADLEFNVPTPDRAIYEIGSVTKQFTAVAILQLVAQGLIDLDEVFTKYLPGYPADNHGITVRRLMDHTSGIKGYTEMEGFGAIATRDLPRDSLVAMFSSAPLDFSPGDAMIYNNSAYFLLGLIIEAVTERTYEEYIDDLFASAGMPDSRYCSSIEIIARRAHGYDANPNGLVRKGYIDHTWPYSAGSLCSTAWDLIAWNQALHGDGAGGQLLNAEGYRELITPGSLSDGTPLRYAKGLAVFVSDGRQVIGHGGGIPGFLSQVTYYPEEELSVVVLVNTAGPPGAGTLAEGITSLLLGDAPDDSDKAYPGDLDLLAGTYSGAGRGQELVVTVGTDSLGLTLAFGEGEPAQFQFVGGSTFRRGSSLVTFDLAANRVERLLVDQISGLYVLVPDEAD